MSVSPTFTALLAATADELWLSALEAETEANGVLADSAGHSGGLLRKKRASDSGSGSGDSPDDEEPEQPRKKPKRRYRKATHTLRKEEKARLLKEMAVLHSQMEDLKSRAMQTCRHDEQTSMEKFVANRVLRSAIQSQQIDLARVHALMSEYFLFDTQAGSPIHHYIQLEQSEDKRHDTLMGMKSRVIADAEDFLTSRFPRMDVLKPMREEHCFEAPNGDYCSNYAAVVQLDGASSVRQVFDAVLSYICNIEISISERLGNITIREGDDRYESGLTQARLVSTTRLHNLLMESNSIYFTQCEDVVAEDGSVRTEAIIVSDFVDEDDLHPYEPATRVRRDVSSILYLSTHSRPRPERPEETEQVVVLKHWVSLRLHYPSSPVSSSGWRELRDYAERWLRSMQLLLHDGGLRAERLDDLELQ